MVIIIKDILYYYNIYQYKIISDNSIYWNGKRLLLQELFDEIIFSNINYPFHKPIKNIYNSYITYFNNKKYVLFSSYFEKNR